jgi:hypothetical protein
MCCDEDEQWQTGLCDNSVSLYAYTAVCPCFVSRDIMRSVLDSPDAQRLSWSEACVNCVGCGVCALLLAEAAIGPEREPESNYVCDACVLYACIWCCTIPLAFLLRTTVCERENKSESCCTSLALSTLWWPCMLVQTKNEMNRGSVY